MQFLFLQVYCSYLDPSVRRVALFSRIAWKGSAKDESGQLCSKLPKLGVLRRFGVSQGLDCHFAGRLIHKLFRRQNYYSRAWGLDTPMHLSQKQLAQWPKIRGGLMVL